MLNDGFLLKQIDWKRLDADNPLDNKDKGWTLESIRTDGVVLEVMLKSFTLRKATEVDLETDLQNMAEGKKRKYKTQGIK